MIQRSCYPDERNGDISPRLRGVGAHLSHVTALAATIIAVIDVFLL